MEDKLNQAADNPAATTDQALKETSSEAPTAEAEGKDAAAAPESTERTNMEKPEDENATTETPESSAETPTEASSATPDSPVDTENMSGEADSEAEAAPEDAGQAEPAEVTEVSAEAAAPAESATVSTAETASDNADNAEAAQAEEIRTEETMTMEEVMAASDDQLARKPIHRGMITTGTVIMLAQDGIVADVNAKIEGVIPYNQLFEFDTNAQEAAKYFKPGDEIQVFVVRADIPNNTIILSKKRADQERAWTLLQDIFEKKVPVEVEIVEKVRGGLVANLGVRAFLPASQIDVRRVNDLTPFVGKRLKVKIIELNRKRNRVIISRRDIIEQEVAGQKEETLRQLEPGARLEGEIVEITDFGAFVNLGGIDGLVHRSELTHGRFNHPKEVVKVGDKVKVEVLDMDLERERINLSMKKLTTNPWENVLANYNIGEKVAGKVTNLTAFGAFVEIEPGLEGLIHVSEMSWTKRVRHPKEIVSEGEELETMILKIDTNQERISLGLRQTQPDPWSSLPDRFPPGTEVTGPITGITDFGVFMEIEEGIEGLVHISELAHEHIEDISEHFNKGDEVTAVILNIDPVEQRASLSRKRLLPYTAGAEGFDAAGDVPMGAPASRGGGRKGGRRGGRRSQGIDYDYSYAASDSGGKTTTKLGDVYADLFAQFGLADSKEEEKADKKADASADDKKTEATTAASTDSQAEVPTEVSTEEAQAERPEVTSESESTEPASETKVESTASVNKAKPQEEAEADPENAIDAAEAAALLTAAFRQGKRPAAEKTEDTDAKAEDAEDENKEEKETSNA